MRRSRAPMRVFAVLALAPLMSACAVLPGAQAARADLPGQVEPVHAAAITRDQAVFWVSSNGCTQKSDLTPVLRTSNEGHILSLRRIKEDRCGQAKPEGVEMRWSFEELGLEPGSRIEVETPYQLPQT